MTIFDDPKSMTLEELRSNAEEVYGKSHIARRGGNYYDEERWEELARVLNAEIKARAAQQFHNEV